MFKHITACRCSEAQVRVGSGVHTSVSWEDKNQMEKEFPTSLLQNQVPSRSNSQWELKPKTNRDTQSCQKHLFGCADAELTSSKFNDTHFVSVLVMVRMPLKTNFRFLQSIKKVGDGPKHHLRVTFTVDFEEADLSTMFPAHCFSPVVMLWCYTPSSSDFRNDRVLLDLDCFYHWYHILTHETPEFISVAYKVLRILALK